MYAQKIIRSIINLALAALFAICLAWMSSCSSTDDLHSVLNAARLGAHYKSLDFHMRGDTTQLKYVWRKLPSK